MLQRVQLLLDQKTKQGLEQVAAYKNLSVSAVAREMLAKQVKKELPLKSNLQAVNILKKLAENAIEGPGDGDYDSYAYGPTKTTR